MEERERCVQLNAEFQRIVRRDKRAFFNGQCKEIEESNRKVKTRDLFKKIGDIKNTCYVSKYGKPSSGHRTVKRSAFIPNSQEGAIPKNVQTIGQLHLFPRLVR